MRLFDLREAWSSVPACTYISDVGVVVALRQGGRRLVKSVRLRETGEPSWIDVDVKSAVERWIKKPRRNFGLQVVVRDASRRRRGGRGRREYDTRRIIDGHDCCNVVDNNRQYRRFSLTRPRQTEIERNRNQTWPWVGLTHGLGWVENFFI